MVQPKVRGSLGQKPQCVLCCSILSNEAIKPSKLKRYLQQKHPEHVEKDLDFFQGLKLLFKRQKLDASGYLKNRSLQADGFF